MRKLSTAVISVVTLLAVGIFAYTYIRAFYFAPALDIAVPHRAQAVDTKENSSYPARLRVPSLKIDSEVQYVGITKAGNMGVPSNYSDVGWYKYGTVPGQAGSAVMAGHVDNGLALAGVFKHLEDVAIGEDIYVDTKGGVVLHFRVVDIRRYHYKEVPTEDIFAQSDGARLNLITCSGDWVKADKTYDERVVVYTALVS